MTVGKGMLYNIRAALPETPLRIAEAHDSTGASHVASWWSWVVVVLWSRSYGDGGVRESLLWRRVVFVAWIAPMAMLVVLSVALMAMVVM